MPKIPAPPLRGGTDHCRARKFPYRKRAERHAPDAAFRDNPAWTVADGALTTQAEAGKTPLVSRATLADSVTSFDFRAPAGARATLYVQGRYAFELVGNGDWQPFALRFRAPRFDAGFNKIQPAFVLDVRNGTDFRRNVHPRRRQ